MSFTHTALPSIREMCEYAAREVVNTVSKVQQGGSEAHIVLTGGTAGIETCRRLLSLHQAAMQQSDSFPIASINWTAAHVYFGDERNVPVTHPDSNEGQARKALLNHIPIPAENIHSYNLDGTPDESYLRAKAAEYENALPGVLDIHLFGVGPDGHVNSLFPGHRVLEATDSLVTYVVDSPKPPAQRLTLTFPAVQRAKKAILLISGKAKAKAFEDISNDAPMETCPAAEVTRRAINPIVLTSELH